MSKGKTTLATMAIAFLVLSGVLVGTATFYSSVAGTYNKTATDIGFSNVSAINDTITQDMLSRVNTGIVFLDFIGWVWNSGLFVIKGFTGIITVFTAFQNFVTAQFAIPGWFVMMVSSVVVFVIGYKVVIALIGREGAT